MLSVCESVGILFLPRSSRLLPFHCTFHPRGVAGCPIHAQHGWGFSLHYFLILTFLVSICPPHSRTHQPAATFSSRSSVSGYRRTSRTSAAACGFGLALPCSHFSSVLSLIRSFLANTAREHRIPFRVSRMNSESTAGSGVISSILTAEESLRTGTPESARI